MSSALAESGVFLATHWRLILTIAYLAWAVAVIVALILARRSSAATLAWALALLALLQREGRLVDFLREPLDGFGDADIGAAARDVHRGCAKVLAQHLTLEPVMPGEEEAKVALAQAQAHSQALREVCRLKLLAYEALSY
jgi:hypothetical protein